MAEQAAGDKTEAPTPRRRQEAREQGNVARSPDLSAAVLVIGGLYLLKFFGGGIIKTLKELVADTLGQTAFARPSHDVGQFMVRAIAAAGWACAPLLVGGIVLAIAVNVAQSGLVFSTARLQWRFEALNPVAGFGRVFGGTRGISKLGMNFFKVVLVGISAYSAIAGRIGQIVLVQQLGFIQIYGLAMEIIFSITLRIGVLLLVLAIIDYFWQRHQIENQLKMSKQEIKDEMKSQDGDPHMKARRRQIAIARLKEQLKTDVPKADVVVTNPTEFAVALRYDPGKMNAPQVVAKGQGLIAARIRELAIAHGIPILERKPLARALYKLCSVGQEVPEQFFSAIAEILAYVYELNGRFKQKHLIPA
jgi:flagellar biosynthetic protein FlhB